MSGSVWYISVGKKKIEFKKYPKKQKQVKNKTSKTKNVVFGFLFFAVSIFFINLVSAAEINDTFHINIQTTFSNGTIQSGTFAFAFNITENSSTSCLGPVVYNYSTSQTTDSRGIVSIYLTTIGSGGGNLSNLNFDSQYYLCYYRDGTLKEVSQLGRVPYSFRAARVNLSKIDIDSNLTLGNFNISGTSGYFSFLGINVTTPLGLLHVVGNGSDSLFVNSTTGNVGVGTTNPTALLDIRNPSSSGVELRIFTASDSSATIEIGTGNDTDWSIDSVNSLSDALVFEKQDSGAAELLVLTQTGLVGINTTTPQNTLNVLGTANVTGAAIFPNSICVSGEVLSTTSTGQLACVADAGAGGNVSGSGTATRVAFWSGSTALSSSANLFWNNTNSRLGIGTTTPQNTLNVFGDTNVTGLLSFGSLAIGAINTTHLADNTIDGVDIADTLTLDANWLINTFNVSFNSGTLFVNKNDSLIGINTSNPWGLLHVVGNGTDSIFVNSTTGNVGIGTTNPNALLGIRNPSSSGVELRIFTASDSSATIEIGTGNDTDWSIDSVNSLSDALVFEKQDSGAAELLVLTQTGLVGINTTTPQNALNVFGAINSTTGFIVNSSVGLTGNFSVGSCWFAYKGGMAYGTNCTAL